MKTRVALCMAAFAASAASHAATIDKVIVRQQWPWSTDVKVEYRLTGVTSPVDVSVVAYDGDTPLDSSKIAAATKGDVYGVSADGDHSLVIDPVAAFGADHAAIPSFNVELSLSDSAAKTTEVLYKIIDLDNFTAQDVTRADFLNGKMGTYETDFGAIGENYWTALQDVLIWTGVTNVPAYKTSKIVMRRVPAKDVTYCMGNNPGNHTTSGCDGSAMVTLTNDFYLSVFEVTEGQYKRMTAVGGAIGTAPSSRGDDYPVTSLSYNALRGDPANWTDWPENQYAVASGTAVAKLRANMPGYLFDLPTEAQWEYACRAGTTNNTYTGIRATSSSKLTAMLQEVAWVSGNTDTLMVGGLKRPNALGFYDMLGNAAEHCRDLIEGTGTTQSQNPPALSGEVTEPYGMSEGTAANHNINSRGGGYSSNGNGHVVCQSRLLNHQRSYKSGTLRLWMRAE